MRAKMPAVCDRREDTPSFTKKITETISKQSNSTLEYLFLTDLK